MCKNLAGNQECDRYIEDELCRAKIQILRIPRKVDNEVPYSMVGVLNGFEFRRAWYYWIVFSKCKLIPLDMAKELYDDPIGKSDIRVDGNAGCPAPSRPTNCYHIDSIEGLRLFADTIRNARLIDNV